MIGLMKQYLSMYNEICVNLSKVITDVLTLFALIPWLWIILTAYEAVNHKMPECRGVMEVPTSELIGH